MVFSGDLSHPFASHILIDRRLELRYSVGGLSSRFQNSTRAPGVYPRTSLILATKEKACGFKLSTAAVSAQPTSALHPYPRICETPIMQHAILSRSFIKQLIQIHGLHLKFSGIPLPNERYFVMAQLWAFVSRALGPGGIVNPSKKKLLPKKTGRAF